MTTIRTAAQAVVDAFADPNARANLRGRWLHLSDCITALRAALAQQEQEPVAWLTASRNTITWDKLYPDMQPLYTHPPRREWVSLTEEEVWSQYQELWPLPTAGDMVKFARAIEQALRSKNT